MMLQQDLTLVEKWRARRDADAFAAIVARHAGLVYATSLRITRNRADAEDVAQECFAALALGETRIRSSLASWLHRAATHRSLDRLRSDRRRRLREQRSPESGSATGEASWSDIQGYVDEAMAELPEKLRFPLVAHFLEGQSYQAIAEALEVPRSTVASRVHRALDVVRRKLRRRGVRTTPASLGSLLTANAIEAVPSTLAAALGKVAIAGAGRVSAGASAPALGGWLLWQKLAGVAALATALGFGTWTATRFLAEEDGPPRQTSLVQVGDADEVAVAAPPETRAADPVPAAAEAAEADGPATRAAAAGDATLVVDEPEPGGTISGRMYDAVTNEPVEGALAYAYPRSGGSAQGRSVPSDGEGRYRITGLADGWYTVSAGRVEGYPRQAPGDRRVLKVADAEPVEGVDFAFTPGIRVAGIVTSAGGDPMSDVRVGGMLGGTGHAEQVRSQRDGFFEVFLLPRGDALPRATETLFLQAQTDELESELVGPLTLTRDGLEGLVLSVGRPRAGGISGAVVDPDGRPLEGVGVHLSRGPMDYLIGSGMTRSDSEGRFRLSRLAAGPYGVLLVAPGVSMFSADDEVLRIDLEEGETLTDLRLVFGEDKGGLAITGRVTDTSGNPIELVEIAAANGRTLRRKTHSGEDGRFRITGLEEGTYFLSAHHVSASGDPRRYSPAQLPGVRAGATDLEIVLHGQAGVEGRAIRADTGEPVTELEVFYVTHAAKIFSAKLLLNGRRITDPDGRFALTNLYAGDATITARAPGLAPSFQVLSLVEHETLTGVELRLEPARRFAGTVVSAAGTPVADALIFLGKIPEMGVESKQVASTEADGSFTIDTFTPGAKVVTAYHLDHGPGFVDVSEGTLIVLPEASRIEGKVTFRGEPGTGVFVRGVYPDRWYLPSPSSTVESDGRYELTGLAPGKIRIWARHESGVRLERDADIEAGGTRVVDLDFAAGTSVIEGRITIAGAAPAEARVSLSIETAAGRLSLDEEARTDGSFRLADLPVGRGVLQVSARDREGGRRARLVKVEVREGEVVRTDVDFAGEGRLTGRLLGLTGELYGSVLLLEGDVQIPEEPDLATLSQQLEHLLLTQTRCATDGTFEIGGLEPGTYTVLAVTVPKGTRDPGSARVDSELVKLGKAETQSLELETR